MSELKTITVHDQNHTQTVDININTLRYRKAAKLSVYGMVYLTAKLNFHESDGDLTYVNFANGHDAIEVVFNEPIAEVRKMFDDFLLSEETEADWSKDTLSKVSIKKMSDAKIKAKHEQIKKNEEDRVAKAKAAEKAAREAKIQKLRNIAGHFNIVGKIRRNGFWWQNKAKGHKSVTTISAKAVTTRGVGAVKVGAPKAKKLAKTPAKKAP